MNINNYSECEMKSEPVLTTRVITNENTIFAVGENVATALAAFLCSYYTQRSRGNEKSVDPSPLTYENCAVNLCKIKMERRCNIINYEL